MSSSNTSSGIGFFGLLGILFIGLKLGKVIDWSWWLVLMPIYAPITLVLGILFLVALGWGIWLLVKSKKAKKSLLSQTLKELISPLAILQNMQFSVVIISLTLFLIWKLELRR